MTLPIPKKSDIFAVYIEMADLSRFMIGNKIRYEDRIFQNMLMGRPIGGFRNHAGRRSA